MKFQKKIIVTYIILSMMIITIFGSIYYVLLAKQFQNKTYTNVETISNIKTKQFRELVDGMESVMSYVLSDIDVIEALKVLAKTNSASEGDLYFDSNVVTVREKLTNYYLMNSFYRVIIFNKQGIVISNTNYAGASIDPEADYTNYPWLKEIEHTGGKNILIGDHSDNWGKQSDTRVISLVKEIQGFEMGYIEVQVSEEMIQKQLDLDDTEKIVIQTKEKSLLFSNMEAGLLSKCQEELNEDNDTLTETMVIDAEKYVCVKNSEDGNFNVLFLVNYKEYSEHVFTIISICFCLICVILFSSVYIFFTSRRLTKPIKQLEHVMHATERFDKIPDLPCEISDDEIGALYNSYCDVIERLHYSLEKEKRMSILQLQSQFDLLQSQVNPHFIFNILNILVERGTYLEDEIICDVCSHLASMLRYSTNTTTKYAPLHEEISYLDEYLSLLQVRFEEKLNYHIEIEERISDHILPKIVLQQIVENSIRHGRDGIKRCLEINIRGASTTYGWYISITDNGSGMDPEQLEHINHSLKEIREKLSDSRTHIEMEIGGMGLVNTYARLYLLYNESLRFEIKSVQDVGTCMMIEVHDGGKEDV